jgi:methionine sulfoxide reductase heme-binding subunit
MKAHPAIITMPSTAYWLERTKRHLFLAALAGLITVSAYIATPPPDVRHRISMGTAYASLVFLAASLWLGPWNVLRRKPNPVSFDLRRDIGIWTGILALTHTAVGLTVHLRGRMWMLFLQTRSSTYAAKHGLRICEFCWARSHAALLDPVGDL